MDFINYIRRQGSWSLRVFGPGNRDKSITDHIRKELKEIADAPGDVEEWIDVIILGIGGALRNTKPGSELDKALEVIECLEMKQEKNIFKRTWPDWKTADLEKPIEHRKD